MHTAWFGTYAETISRSPMRPELLDAKHRLSAEPGLRRPQAGTAGWSATSSPKPPPPGAGPGAGRPHGGHRRELLIGSARGLQSSTPSPAAYRRYLKALVRVAGRRAIQHATLPRRITAAGVRLRTEPAKNRHSPMFGLASTVDILFARADRQPAVEARACRYRAGWRRTPPRRPPAHSAVGIKPHHPGQPRSASSNSHRHHAAAHLQAPDG